MTDLLGYLNCQGPEFAYLGHFRQPECLSAGHNTMMDWLQQGAQAEINPGADWGPREDTMFGRKGLAPTESNMPLTPSEQNAIKNMESPDRSRSTYAPQDCDV